MKTTAFAIALLMGGAAFAQNSTQPDLEVDADVDAHSTTTAQTGTAHDMSTHTMANTMTPASGAVVQPSNANPERDARGIAVISAAAMVPAGWNGITATAVGGPLVDPVSGATIDAADDSYPACTARVTDNCLQTYERGRRS